MWLLIVVVVSWLPGHVFCVWCMVCGGWWSGGCLVEVGRWRVVVGGWWLVSVGVCV